MAKQKEDSKELLQKENPPIVTYVGYDKKTGKIIHIHQRFQILEEEEVAKKEKSEQEGKSVISGMKSAELNIKEVRSLIGSDQFVLNQLTDKKISNLEIIMTTNYQKHDSVMSTGFRVDTKSKKLIEKARIQLSSDRTILNGDGKDSTLIKIEIVDNKNQIATDFDGTIKVNTNRGKLSEKGGIVNIKNGVGEIRLTATNETINRVSVTAQCPDGSCAKGHLNLEFV